MMVRRAINYAMSLEIADPRLYIVKSKSIWDKCPLILMLDKWQAVGLNWGFLGL